MVIVVDVAGETRHGSVSIRQWKSRRVVVELRSEPAIHRVTRLAGRGKAHLDVIRIRGLLIIFRVAANAIRR